MTIRVTCPARDAGFRAPDEAAGKRGKCPGPDFPAPLKETEHAIT